MTMTTKTKDRNCMLEGSDTQSCIAIAFYTILSVTHTRGWFLIADDPQYNPPVAIASSIP